MGGAQLLWNALHDVLVELSTRNEGLSAQELVSFLDEHHPALALEVRVFLERQREETLSKVIDGRSKLTPSLAFERWLREHDIERRDAHEWLVEHPDQLWVAGPNQGPEPGFSFEIAPDLAIRATRIRPPRAPKRRPAKRR